MSKVRVFLVDDHAIFREGLRMLLSAHEDLEVVGEASDGAALSDAVRAAQPAIVVMDISMPRVNGADATRALCESFPGLRVLVLTAHEDAAYAQHLLAAGASGYLLKRAAAADVVRAIHALAAGQLYLDTTTSARLRTVAPVTASSGVGPRATAQDILSERETEVLRMVALGHSMKRMAASLGLSTRTLETYKRRGMAKLALKNRADIVRLALERGWIDARATSDL